MADNGGDGCLPDEQRCKRTDGRKWRCRKPAMEGKALCEAHFLQIRRRQHNEPVPDSLKVDRPRRSITSPKIEDDSTQLDVGLSSLPLKRGKRIQEATSKHVFDEKSTRVAKNPTKSASGLSRKRAKSVTKEQPSVVVSDQLNDDRRSRSLKRGRLQLDLEDLQGETGNDRGKLIIKELKYGTMEIPQVSPPSQQLNKMKNAGSSNVKIGGPAPQSVPTRLLRSKNAEPLPIATVQILPSVKANIKASAKSKKRCHWCRWSSYRAFVKCSTCKKQFFCEDCINERYHDKAAVKRECPVCLGTCFCRACTRGRPKEVETKPKEVETKEPVVRNREIVVYNRGKKFEKIQELHLIRQLLPLLEQINQEKVIELDAEARNRGKPYGRIHVPIDIDYPKRKCRFCKAFILDVHRSCGYCSYILCMLCCQEFCEGYLRRGLEDLENTRIVRSKSLSKISWKSSQNGMIRCPPKNVGGCGHGYLNITSFSPFSWTKDLEASAKLMDYKYKFKKPLGVASTFCTLCEEKEEMGSEKVGNLNKKIGLYFSTRQDFRHKNLQHFMKHWWEGRPLIIRDVLKCEPELSWDLGFMFCAYLERSAEFQNGIETVKAKRNSESCKVVFGRSQVYMRGKTHANAWQEFLKCNVWLSSVFFQDQFPIHYTAVMQSLPLQEYMNPLTGFLNLAANLPQETRKKHDLGPSVYISCRGPEELMKDDSSTKLCYHAYDVVYILAHATERPISKEKLNEAKILMHKYSSQEPEDNTYEETTHMPDGEVHMSSDDLSTKDADDEDFRQYEAGSSGCHEGEQVVDTCGAQWDIFRRQDVPKLVQYLKDYSDKLGKSDGSPEKVVHPILDEIFYLDDYHKANIKEQFNVEPWSFKQDVGEAVIVPAGCPYQIKKPKSCVNVVLGFISPESASECVKLNDELRQLPVNHKAKKTKLEIRKMAIDSMLAAIEELRKVSPAERSGTP